MAQQSSLRPLENVAIQGLPEAEDASKEVCQINRNRGCLGDGLNMKACIFGTRNILEMVAEIECKRSEPNFRSRQNK